ncbi:flagellar hook-associated protein FlgK [Thalassomonas actiniarum]|uniref:Flagellar hook-associated protein 1 n=1 Tax=Thalassomonas actiniarum TaxID=485447 RepID=A0AAE9YQQ0_9GAMM|nr:flagellar hook-associated protein FlgK [Thalassomonas actiniarum]WDD99315.1 flagellar hook-associated protein FlgK [Thalassomonas actiniarum]
MSMLSNGLSGLTASQIALNVVSNNIANSNVAGYTRQQTVNSALISNSNNSLSSGSGVEVSAINRITDDYLNNNLWRSNSSYGFNQAYSDYLGVAEQLLANENLSLSVGMDDLFNAFNSASTEPSSIAPRQLIISSAEALTQKFNSLAANLDIQRVQIEEQADGMLEMANSLFAEVATLNQEIVDGTAQGANISALLDQRDETVNSLSKLMDVEVARMDNGSYTLSMTGGQPLVLGSSAASLTRVGNDYQVNLAGQPFSFSGDIGGQLGGILSYETNILDTTEASLNQLAQDLADDVNNQLALGQDINTIAGAGAPLFDYNPLDPAGSLSISAGFEPEDLALGAIGAGPGDNSNLSQIIALKDGHYDSYNSLVGTLAIQSGQAGAEAQASKSIADDALAQRDSVSAVNLDEEAMSLIQYQQSYQANAKVVSASQQLFNTLLSMF